jgi:hypothetical protein
MLVIENLDGATVERAAALVAREQAAARQVRPELPADFESAEVCAAALERLSGSGHHGLVATEDGRAVAVMTAAVRENPAARQYVTQGWAAAPQPGQFLFTGSDFSPQRAYLGVGGRPEAFGLG